MANTPTAQVAANVRAEIARAGRTQTDVAERLHMTQSALSKRLNGRIPFDINEISAISAELGVPMSALVKATATTDPAQAAVS